MVDPAHDRGAHRVTKVALMVAAATAVALVALSTFGLRWAHTYRQASQEGLAFVSVGMGLVAASAGAVFAVAVLLWARARTSPRRHGPTVGTAIQATLQGIEVVSSRHGAHTPHR